MKKHIVNQRGGNPYGFTITGDDGQSYYAHLGDLKENEIKLYNSSSSPTYYLKKGDKVQFEPFNLERNHPAIHVEIMKN